MSVINLKIFTIFISLLFLTSCSVKDIDTQTDKTLNDTSKASQSNITSNNSTQPSQPNQASNKNKRVFSTDSDSEICQAYTEALNKYPPVVDFFVSPLHPNSPKFTYPKWEQWDIYENIELFSTFLDILYDETAYNDPNPFETSYPMSQEHSNEIKAKNRKDWQMYYTRVDFYNKGRLNDVIKLYDYRYYGYFLVFLDEQPKTFAEFDKQALEYTIEYPRLFDLFYYQDKLYVKGIYAHIRDGKVDMNWGFKMGLYSTDDNRYYRLGEICGISDY